MCERCSVTVFGVWNVQECSNFCQMGIQRFHSAESFFDFVNFFLRGFL